MSSSIKLKNANGKTVSVTNSNANQTDKEIIYLNTVDELANASGSINAVAIVSDIDRGGTFEWSATGTANGGTVFAGATGYWNRQYSGAVNVKWFGADIQKAMAYALENSKKVAFDFNATIRIPTDAPTLQQAIDSIEASQGVTIDLLIESGHQPSVGISVSNGDYSCFTISSVDAEVFVSATINTAFLYANNANAPRLNCLINAQGNVFQGCSYSDNSTGFINSGCGVKNVQERGLYASNSRVSASGCNFSGAGQANGEYGRCLWATRCSSVSCENANFTNCAGITVSVYISRASTVHAAGMTVSIVNGSYAVWAHRSSRLNAQNCIVSGGTSYSLFITRSSTASINEATINAVGGGMRALGLSTIYAFESVTISRLSGTGSIGIWCSGSSIAFDGVVRTGFLTGMRVDGGGLLNANNCTIEPVVTGGVGVHATDGSRALLKGATLRTNSSNVDVGCEYGSIISLHGATTTNSTTAGVPIVTDTSAGGRGGFNAFMSSGRGIIFA